MADNENMNVMNETVKELRSTIETVEGKAKSFDEKMAALDGIDASKVKKINDFLDTQEEKNQELVKKEAQERKEAEEMKEKMADLEKAIATKSTVDKKNYKDTPEYKALNMYAQKGDEVLYDAEYKDYLRTDSNTQGGFTVPEMIAQEILREIEEVSNVRSFARVRSTQTKSLDVVIRDSIPTAPYEGEGEEGDEDTSTYKSETMTAYRQSITVPVTSDILAFSQFDMMSEVGRDAALAFAKGEGTGFVTGTGVRQPEGILTNSDIENVETDTSLTTSLDDVIKLAGELKEGYNPVYFMNRKTLHNLRVEKSSNGYLWTLGGDRMPNQINGYSYTIFQDMEDDDTAGNNPVGFGDLFMGYNILDALQMSMIRDDYTNKKKAIVEFTWHRWNTGIVVLPEAIKLLKVKA